MVHEHGQHVVASTHVRSAVLGPRPLERLTGPGPEVVVRVDMLFCTRDCDLRGKEPLRLEVGGDGDAEGAFLRVGGEASQGLRRDRVRGEDGGIGGDIGGRRRWQLFKESTYQIVK